MRNKDFHSMREEYEMKILDEKDLPASPFNLLEKWIDEAVEARIPDANAMILSTADPSGFPDSRVVLLKGIEDMELIFFFKLQFSKRKTNGSQ